MAINELEENSFQIREEFYKKIIGILPLPEILYLYILLHPSSTEYGYPEAFEKDRFFVTPINSANDFEQI